ncbi:MAG TPA: polyprenyl synthetase family protein [Duganella sp.]|jgi:geranylgeranyl diphosphate synthase type II
MATETRRFNGLGSENLPDPSETEIDDLRGELEQRIGHFLSESNDKQDPLTAAMRAATLSTGKRMRPLLLMLVARDLGCSSPALLDAACAVEMVHAASLILDDMPCMDDAKLRRGNPTVHIQFGENVAILASVALLSRAFHILAQAPHISALTRTRLISALAETIGAQGLVRGQFEDLHGGQKRSVDDIAMTNELKTGVLLGLSVEMAGIIAQADERVLKSLRAFAMSAGHAFQIKDDLQDGPGNDSAVTGKDVGKDAGKATLSATLGLEKTEHRLAAHLREADGYLTDAIGSKQRTRRLVGNLFRKACPVIDLHAS